MANCVTLDSTGQVLRHGYCDFENDGAFNASLETYHVNVGLFLETVPLKYTKVVASALVEMTVSERDAVDAAAPPSLERPFMSVKACNRLPANMDIDYYPYLTILDGHDDPVHLLTPPVKQTLLKKIRNDTAGSVIVNINGGLEGAVTNSLVLQSKGWAVLCYKNGVWVLFDDNAKSTLS